MMNDGDMDIVLAFFDIESLIAHSLSGPQTLFGFSKTFFEYLMITGVTGVAISVLTID